MITIARDGQREAVLEVIKEKINSSEGNDKIRDFWRTVFMLVDLDADLSPEYKATTKRLVKIHLWKNIRSEYNDAQLLATLIIATSDYLA